MGGSSRSSEDPGHQLAGLGAARPTPGFLPVRGARAGREEGGEAILGREISPCKDMERRQYGVFDL